MDIYFVYTILFSYDGSAVIYHSHIHFPRNKVDSKAILLTDNMKFGPNIVNILKKSPKPYHLHPSQLLLQTMYITWIISAKIHTLY